MTAATLAVCAVLAVFAVLGISGCGTSSRFSPVAVINRMEQKKGADVRDVSCIEQSRLTEYSCSVTLADGKEHRVTVVVSSDGRAVVSPKVGAPRSAPTPLEGFHRVT